MPPITAPSRPLSNGEIARRLVEVAQMLRAKGENPFKIRAYRRAAETVAELSESVDGMVRAGEDLTRFPGIGKGIAAALKEIVFSGTLGQLEIDLTALPPEQAAANDYPALDAKKVARIFKRFGIATVAELKAKLEEGAIAAEFGPRLADHVRF